MDEIDAALDFRNVSIIANYLLVDLSYKFKKKFYRSVHVMLNLLLFRFAIKCMKNRIV